MKIRSLCTALFMGLVLASAFPAFSAEEAKFELKASSTIRDILVEKSGKRVALRLVSGQEVEGTVTMVGNSLVQISGLVGMEYFDAVVSIDKITAIRMRMRDR